MGVLCDAGTCEQRVYARAYVQRLHARMTGACTDDHGGDQSLHCRTYVQRLQARACSTVLAAPADIRLVVNRVLLRAIAANAQVDVVWDAVALGLSAAPAAAETACARQQVERALRHAARILDVVGPSPASAGSCPGRVPAVALERGAAVDEVAVLAGPAATSGLSLDRMVLEPTASFKRRNPQVRSLASETTTKILLTCALATNMQMEVVARLWLLLLYQVCLALADQRRAGILEIALPLALRFAGPAEWGRCAPSCRQSRAWGVAGMDDMVRVWLSGFSKDTCTELLKHAVQQGTGRLVRPLLEARADVNCCFEQFWFRTPLHRAASRDQSDLCRVLLASRADPQRRDLHGATPLHIVASRSSPDRRRLPIVEDLLGSDPGGVSVVDYSGRTPCHMAALTGHLATVQLLLERRASVASLTPDGRTPADMARRGQHLTVLGFLEDFRRQAEAAEARPAVQQVLGAIYEQALEEPA